MKHICAGAIALVALVGLQGCVTTPELDTSVTAERSFDGLYPFSHTEVDQAWARADLNLTGYTKVKLESAGIRYRPTEADAGTQLRSARRSRNEFPIDADSRARLQDVVAKAFADEMQKLEHLQVTDETGPNVLIVRGALIDVVSKVPPQSIGRVDVYLESVGEATLVIELIDSQTKSVLVRAIDRRAADQGGSGFKSNSVTNWREVEHLAEFWARLLRERLDGMASTMQLREDAI